MKFTDYFAFILPKRPTPFGKLLDYQKLLGYRQSSSGEPFPNQKYWLQMTSSFLVPTHAMSREGLQQVNKYGSVS